MEIAKTPYKSVYMVVPKTKFSKFSKSVYMPIRIYDGPTLYPQIDYQLGYTPPHTEYALPYQS